MNNNALIAGIVSLVFAVIFSIIAAYDENFDIVAGGFYFGAMYGIFIGMLNDKKAEENG